MNRTDRPGRGSAFARLVVLAPALLAIVACGAAVAAAQGPSAASDKTDDKVDFNRDVRPILSGTCFKCHGTDENTRKARLRLDVREAALKPARSGEVAIVPGKPDASELVKRVFSDDEGEVMPPPSTKVVLTAQQKRTLRRWIEQGAEYQEHWAFVLPREHPLPAVKQEGWPRNAIDRFVLAQLEAVGLSPSPEADRYTLVRRLYLDLIGLPPTPEEADAFVRDTSPEAYEKLVDKLLASPHYGERWARRWMDLARYADTNGYEKDRPRSMWPWRDWLIDAINRDVPFDRFTIEQIAGDMLPDATPQTRIATGFNRNTMINEEGGVDPLEYRFHAMVDRVHTVGTTWLGLTIACAQCHSHKYDPISQKEYYQFMAFMNNADEPVMEVPTPEVEAKRREVQAKVDRLRAELPGKFALKDDVEWVTPSDGKLSAGGKEQARRLPDGSFRLPDRGPERATYTVTFDTPAADVSGLRLEALTDAGKGPGRAPNGNFVLNELIAVVTPRGPDGKPQAARTLRFARAQADFEQEGFKVGGAIDGKPGTGWAVAPPENKARAATFFLDRPVALPHGARWEVRLEQNYGGGHTLLRPRISTGVKVVRDARPVEVRRAEAIAKAFATWQEKQAERAAAWTMIRPTKMSSNAPTLTLLDDGSVLVSGDVTKSDTYDLTFAGDFKDVTALRLEALPHPSLPNGGPGKVHYEGPFGDFFLCELTLAADGTPLKFVEGHHSYASGGNVARNCIDGDPLSGWSIAGQQGRDHHAVFALEKPAASAKELRVKMLFEKYYAAPLGRFRIWVSTDPKAGRAAPVPPEVDNALATPVSRRTAEQAEAIFRQFLAVAPELAEARKEIDAAIASMPRPPTTLVMAERPPGHVRPTHRHHRGEFTQPREPVEPAVPAFLPPLPKGAKADRLGFARWLVSPENPLTARVTVNRQWAAFFGRGLVRTTEDFGFQGSLPSHPELLDHLAIEFVRQGWSMKKLHRLIVTSATYRQSSRVTPELLAVDPQNVLLARGPRFRADAEALRDAALRAAGLLSAKMGGPSVFPPQIPSITTEGAYGPLVWNVSSGEDRYRRSVYTFAKRTAPFALYGTFDAPSGEACTARREVTNTPLQALSLMNDQVFVEAAQALGRLAAKMKADDGQRVAEVFRRLLTRPPEEAETRLLVEFVRAQRERLARKELDAAKIAGAGVEGDPTEPAAWTTLARAVMNLDEMVTKR